MLNAEYNRNNWIFPDKHSLKGAYIGSVDKYTITMNPENNKLLTVTKNGSSKTVCIEDCGSEFVYKLMKTKIKANHGAKGLYDFLTEALDEKFMECYAWKVLDHIVDTMKPCA